jgi:hypothetical protein
MSGFPGSSRLHRVDARVGDQKVEGAEIVGVDPAQRTYVTQNLIGAAADVRCHGEGLAAVA